ncbi:MAG: cache domain-containing protein, partial [Oscillospiraceae bacterium]|nr:cache domain-containing protein [Oscillospiraceae bacterium]
MLGQITGKLELTNTFIANFCANIYYSQAATDIMYGDFKDGDHANIVPNIRSVTSNMVRFAPYIHSVYIYRNQNNTWYSTYTGFGTEIMDQHLQQVIRVYDHVPVLKPIARKIREKTPTTFAYTDVFSYFFYKTIDAAGRFDGAVVVNVDPRWLVDSLDKPADAESPRYFLMTSDQMFVGVDASLDPEWVEELRRIYDTKLRGAIARGVTADMVPHDIGGTRYMVSYNYLKDTQLILFKAESFAAVYAPVNSMKITVFIIACAMIILSVIISLFMSSKIYRPVRNLVNHFGGPPSAKGPGRLDELGVLQNTYVKSIDTIFALRREVDTASDIKYKYHLMQLLVNSQSLAKEDFAVIGESGLFHIDITRPMMMILIKLEDKLAAETPDDVLAEVEGGLTAALSDMLNPYATNDVVNFHNYQIIAFLNPDTGVDPAKFSHTLRKEIEILRQRIDSQYGFSFAAIFSGLVHEPRAISAEFNALSHNLEYRYILGSDAIITMDQIALNVENRQNKYPRDKEARLVRELRAQNLHAAENLLDEIILSIKTMSYSNIVASAFCLCNVVRDTVNEIRRKNFINNSADTLGVNPMEYATVYDL